MSLKQTEFSELEAFIGEKELELARSDELLEAAKRGTASIGERSTTESM